MSQIDRDAVKKLAMLSRLEFSEEALDEIVPQLEDIRKFISKLSEADTAGVEPLMSVLTDENGAIRHVQERPDEVTQPVGTAERDAMQHNAPATEMGFYVVPRVVE